jgi:crotonobetainyl-CoA:carnitine CoA-transferase CaiB-like acyl-CoA transferase
MEVRAPHPAAGEVRMVANPVKFSATPVAHGTPPPLLGEHTEEVLSAVLGMEAGDVARLRKEGIV